MVGITPTGMHTFGVLMAAVTSLATTVAPFRLLVPVALKYLCQRQLTHSVLRQLLQLTQLT